MTTPSRGHPWGKPRRCAAGFGDTRPTIAVSRVTRELWVAGWSGELLSPASNGALADD